MKKALVFIVSLMANVGLFGMHIKYTKDIDTCIREKYKHLSLLLGASSMENGVIENYWRNSSKQGDQNERSVKIDLYGENNNTTRLLHTLFRLNGENFDYSRHDPANRLSIETIAKLIATIEKHRNTKTKTPDTLSPLLIECIKSSEAKGEKRTSLIKAIVGSLEECGYFNTRIKSKYVENFTTIILLSFVWQKIKTKKECKDFYLTIKSILPDFLLENNVPRHWETSEYEESGEIILKKIDSDLEDIIKIDKSVIPLFVNIKKEDLTYSVISLKNYTGKYPKFSLQGALCSDYLTKSDYFKNIKVKEQKNLLIKTMPFDCVENSIRNLMNAYLYNKENKSKFNLNQLPTSLIIKLNNPLDDNLIDLEKYDLSLLPPGFLFYSTHSNPSQTGSQQLHTDWGNLCSDIPGVHYNRRMKIIKDQDTKEFTFIYEHYQKQNNNIRYIKPSDNDGWHYYEVGSTVNNIITIINHLFGYSFSNFDDFITTFKLECDYKKDKKSPWLKYDKTQISDNHIFIKMKMPNNCVCIIEVKGKHTELEFKQKEQTFDCADVIHKNFTIHKKPTTTSLLTLQLFPINLDEKLLDIKPDYLTYCCMCQALNDTSKLVETLKILALYIEKQPKTTSLLLSYHLNLINALIRHNDPDITASVILDLIGYSWTKNLPQLKAIINQELEKEIFSGIQICKLLTTLVDKNWDLDFIKLIAKGQQEMLSKSLAKSDLIGQSVLYKEIIKIDKDFTNKKMFEFNTNTVFKEDLGITDNLTDSDKDKILALHSTIEEQEKETIIKKLMKVCNKITKHEADEFIKLKNINPKLREQPELIKINAATQILLIHDSAIKDKALQIIKTNESFSNDEQIDKKAILKKQFDLHDDQAEKIISIINDSTASRNQIHKKLFSILKINSRLSKNEVKNVAIIIGDHKEWIDEKIMNLKMESNYDCIQIYEILKRVKYVSIWDEQWLNKLKNKYYTLLTTTEDDEEEELGANNLFGDDDSDDDDIDDEA